MKNLSIRCIWKFVSFDKNPLLRDWKLLKFKWTKTSFGEPNNRGQPISTPSNHYNIYNNRNHVHSPHIYSQFQRPSPQGLAKKSEGTLTTKGNLFMSVKGNFRCQFVYSLIWVFWWNQPYYWKRRQLEYPTTLLGDGGILIFLVC